MLNVPQLVNFDADLNTLFSKTKKLIIKLQKYLRNYFLNHTKYLLVFPCHLLFSCQ